MATEDRKLGTYPKEEIVQLVRSLDRKQDEGLFSQDVLQQYPHLAQAYTKVCPKRSDLSAAAQRAARGEYSHDARLTPLREDIDLMVDNCRRFNGPTGPLVDMANRFGAFAHEQINAYIAKKTGGRRASALRILSASDAAASPSARGAKNSNNNNNNSSNNHHNSGSATSGNGVRGAPDDRRRKRHREEATEKEKEKEETAAQPISAADVVKLVDALSHREYRRAFRVDVGEMYPHLRKAYEEVCPEKMNLTMVRERAVSGYYTQQPQQQEQQTQTQQRRQQREESERGAPLFGDSVADSFVRLRRDVELMVSNCVRFNANESSWVNLARAFQHFAHNLIDEFVIRHAPALRGTRTGVDAHTTNTTDATNTTNITNAETERKGRGKEEEEKSDRRRAEAEGDDERVQKEPPAHAQEGEERKRKEERKEERREERKEGKRRAAADVALTSRVALTVQPTPLQPPLAPPPALRQRIVADHLRKETLRARLIRSGGANFPDFPDFPPALSGRAALSAFVASARDFFCAARARQNFLDAFEYTRQEEQLYTDCAALIAQQFERLFPHALLYSQEKVDVFEWRAAEALRNATERERETETGGGRAAPATRWLDETHLCYLVRFLVHFPQLMGLACATSVPPAEPQAKPALQVTTVAKGVIDKLAKITDELLTFIAQYEEKVSERPVVQENEEGKQESEKVETEALTSKEENINEEKNVNETSEVNEAERAPELGEVEEEREKTKNENAQER